jgi:hypothetical protein
MDQKRLDNVKQRFDEIKLSLDSTSETTLNSNNKCSMSNCDNSDILENKEHIEVLRKMYQEATHKLMIFRNALKEKQSSQHKADLNKNAYESKYSPTQQLSSSSSSSASINYINNNPTQPINLQQQQQQQQQHNQQISYRMNNQFENRREKLSSSSSSTSSSSNSKSRNGYAQRNLSDLDELTEEDQERNYYNNNFHNMNNNEVNINNVLNSLNQNQTTNHNSNKNFAQDSNSLTQSISNSHNTVKTNPNYYNTKLNQIISSSSKEQENQKANNDNNNNDDDDDQEHDENYDYSGDETLSDDEYRLIEDENDDDFGLDDENNLNENIQHYEDEHNENECEPIEDQFSKLEVDQVKLNCKDDQLNNFVHQQEPEEYEIPIQTEEDEEDTLIENHIPAIRNGSINSPHYFAESTNSTSSTSSRKFYSRTIKQDNQVVIEEKYEDHVENNLNEMFYDRVERNQFMPKMINGKYFSENNQMSMKHSPVETSNVEIKPIIRCESNISGIKNKPVYSKRKTNDQKSFNQEQYFLINDDEGSDFKMNFYKIKQQN